MSPVPPCPSLGTTPGTRPALPGRPHPASLPPASSGYRRPRPFSRRVLAGLPPGCFLSHPRICQAALALLPARLSKPQPSLLHACSENTLVASGNRCRPGAFPAGPPPCPQPLPYTTVEGALSALRLPVCVHTACGPAHPTCPTWAQSSLAWGFAGTFLLTLHFSRSQRCPRPPALVALPWL